MKELYSKYLSILRGFVQHEPPCSIDAEELNNVLSIARINSSEGIAAYTLMEHSGSVPEEVRPVLRKLCLKDISLYSKRAEQLKILADRINENGIDCILFKGIIVRDYYPVPELRTFSDVDIVIKKPDRKKCHELMLELGYESRDDWEPVYTYVKGAEYYEIHTDVMEIDVSDKADYREYYSHIWEHVRPCKAIAGEHIYEFTPEFHLLYMLTHIAKHINGSGAGIRMYLDIALFIKNCKEALDVQWIQRELKVLCFEDFANMVFTSVEKWFGVKSPIELRPVAEEVLDDFLEFTVEGGIYGRVGRDKSVVFLKQQGRGEEKVSRIKTLTSHMFPSADSMKNRYTYLQKHRWMLPVAWVHRLLISRREWGRFAENTKNIITADSEDVLRLKRIYTEIGL